MRRMKDERGAVAIIVAAIMVPLLICTALVVDMGSAYVRTRELQNAADAAALAIALDCAGGHCGSITTTANTFPQASVGSGPVTAVPTVAGSSATVDTASVVNFSFAPVVGIDDTTVGATATATWGSPSKCTAQLPLAFSWCSFAAQTGGGLPTGTTPTTIFLPKTDGTACTVPTGNPVPGGFAWLKADGTECTNTSGTAVDRTPSDSVARCRRSAAEADFVAMRNRSLVVPIYDTFGGTGSNAWYHVYAYAAFRITGYSFGGQYTWPGGKDAPCKGNAAALRKAVAAYIENGRRPDPPRPRSSGPPAPLPLPATPPPSGNGPPATASLSVPAAGSRPASANSTKPRARERRNGRRILHALMAIQACCRFLQRAQR